jgi:hypothetical protein
MLIEKFGIEKATYDIEIAKCCMSEINWNQEGETWLEKRYWIANFEFYIYIFYINPNSNSKGTTNYQIKSSRSWIKRYLNFSKE